MHATIGSLAQRTNLLCFCTIFISLIAQYIDGLLQKRLENCLFRTNSSIFMIKKNNILQAMMYVWDKFGM